MRPSCEVCKCRFTDQCTPTLRIKLRTSPNTALNDSWWNPFQKELSPTCRLWWQKHKPEWVRQKKGVETEGLSHELWTLNSIHDKHRELYNQDSTETMKEEQETFLKYAYPKSYMPICNLLVSFFYYVTWCNTQNTSSLLGLIYRCNQWIL